MRKFSFTRNGPEILHAYFNIGFSRYKLHEPGLFSPDRSYCVPLSSFLQSLFILLYCIRTFPCNIL